MSSACDAVARGGAHPDGHPVPSGRGGMFDGRQAFQEKPMTVLLLILGIVLGALAAALLARPNRERMRDELKSITVDVMAQTGASLAQSVADARAAEQERTAGEMARRTEEIKGLVAPVQEKLGRMEGEIGRLERESH